MDKSSFIITCNIKQLINKEFQWEVFSVLISLMVLAQFLQHNSFCCVNSLINMCNIDERTVSIELLLWMKESE